jgi:hypothetical protein
MKAEYAVAIATFVGIGIGGVAVAVIGPTEMSQRSSLLP